MGQVGHSGPASAGLVLFRRARRGRSGDVGLVEPGRRGNRRNDGAGVRWGDYIKRAAVRRIVWIVVGVAVYALLGWLNDARAQMKDCSLAGYGCTIEEAYAWAAAGIPIATNSCLSNPPTQPRIVTPYHVQHFPAESRFIVQGACEHDAWPHNGEYTPKEVSLRVGRYSSACPAGSTWNEDLNRCFDPAECHARNAMEGFAGVGQTVRPFSSRCIAGCRFAAADAQCTTVDGSIGQSCTGHYEWTGDQCSTNAPDPNDPHIPDTYETPEGAANESDKNEDCIAASGGQTYCKKRSGENCYTASTGREICWQPGETGEKSDHDVLQKVNAGDTAIPPANPNLPSGDTLNQKGDPITTRTSNASDPGREIVTTATNYETERGTNPGSGNQGQPTGGSSGKDSDEGEKGSVSGGGSCDDPPIARGGDPVVVAIVDQTWATRCAVEAGNAAKVTGDVGDCSKPFVVEGSNANAVKLRAMREQICGEYAKGEREGVSSVLEGAIASMEGEFESIWGDGDDSGSGGIVTTRYGGGGSCPVIEVTLPITGQTWTPPPQFCSLIAGLRLLFIAVATVWALRIIGD